MSHVQRGAAAFLDRDGTILDELGYLLDPTGVKLLPGTGDAVRRLNEAGLPVVVLTNQSAIARGLLDADGLGAIHARMAELLAAHGAHLDLILHCPHHPDFDGSASPCACRKPSPGMIEEACQRLDLRAELCSLVGDSATDLVAGARAGVEQLLLVKTGKGPEEQPALDTSALSYHCVPDLDAAVDAILRPFQGK